jgi:hypothetical protein
MKRNKITYPIVKEIKPFFWKECRFCGKEFKRELGFEILDYTAVNPSLYYSYCCNECGDSIETVKKLVDGTKLRFPPRDKSIQK